MVDTIKFSQMMDGGDLANNEKTPGLLGGANVLFNNPWTFLPPGTTADRPAPSAAINYRLRFNTDDQLYEYYDAVLGAWTQLQESAFTVGPFVTYTADASLPDAQNLGLLANGILKQTITAASATLDIAVNGVDYYGPGYTGYLVSPSGFADAFSNPILNVTSPGALAVNYLRISSNIAGNGPTLGAVGSDTDIALNIGSKGAGPIGLITAALTTPLFIYNGTANQHLTRFAMANTAADRTVTFQDASGTLAFLSDIPAGSPSALTKVDDSNVTITLGGTPATALLQAVSLTMGWTGTLSGTRGGTGVNNGASTITLGGSLSTIGAFTAAFTMTGNTAVTFPTSGTLATTSQLVTPAALTKTDDTNVTLTLGGSPSTALVNAASLTLGWTGQLAVARGGTGISSFGTGVATALGQNVTGSGAIVLANGPTFVTSTVTAPSITFSSTSGIIGTTTNNDAAAGSVGEFVSASLTFGTPVSLTTDTPANVTSIDLTAGDWDVWGNVGYTGGATTLVQYCFAASTQTSATLPTTDFLASATYTAAGLAIFASANILFNIQQQRVSLSGTTTIYLVAQAGFSVSTCSAYGNIRARRRR
jgi:hypothetical protein